MHDVNERKNNGKDHKRRALLSTVKVVEHEEPGVSVGSQREPVGRESSGATAGGPPDRAAEGGEEEKGPEEFDMATPRPPEDREDAASPDLVVNRPEVEAMGEAEAGTNTGDSEVRQERALIHI